MWREVSDWGVQAYQARTKYFWNLTTSLASGDSLSAGSILSTEPAGLVVGTPDLTGAPFVAVTVSGGTPGTRYGITAEISTAAGNIVIVSALIGIFDPQIALADFIGPGMIGSDPEILVTSDAGAGCAGSGIGSVGTYGPVIGIYGTTTYGESLYA